MTKKLSLKMSTLWGILLVFCMLPAIEFERLLGLIPLHYPIFIFLILITYLLHGRKFADPLVLGFFIFFTLYYVYSLSFVSDVRSASIYYVLWVTNVVIFNCALSLNKRGMELVADVYCSFIIISLGLGVLSMAFLNGVHANPYLAWDKNNFSFAVYVAFMLAILHGKRNVAITIGLGSVLIFSRTILLMYLVVAAVVYIKKRPSFFSVFVFATVILFVMLGDVLLNSLGFLGERLLGATNLIAELTNFIRTGDELGSVQLDDWRRYYLFIANIDIAQRTFPHGTGMGLNNYLEYFDPKFLVFTGQAARAHNFIISYTGEMGLLFLIFLLLFARILSRSVNIFAFSGLLGLFAGLITNEYITAPMPWFLLGIAINKNLLPQKDA